MEKIIIGSHAAKYWFPDFPREPKDLDLVVKEHAGPKIINKVEHHTLPLLWKYHDPKVEYLTSDLLYTLKVSHSIWKIHHDKTIFDIEFFRNKNCSINEEFLDELVDYWNQKYGKRNSLVFDKKNEEFFKDSVKRKLNHDSLHEIIKYYERPLFEKIKYDLNLAKVEQELFKELSPEDRLKLIREEAYVLAVERFIFKNKHFNVQIAYIRALKMLITRLFEDWLALYAIKHYRELILIDNFFKQKLNEITISKNH